VEVAVTDQDCAGVHDVKGGLPASGYSWPLAGSFERICINVCIYVSSMYVSIEYVCVC
jgi:hypothetical protein